MTELWQPIAGYERLYDISNWGRVRSHHQRTASGPRILRYHFHDYGYAQVSLYKNGKRRTCLVHSLVAQAFLGPCPAGQLVRHGPAGKLDNSVQNLSYGTRQQIADDLRRDGTLLVGEKGPSAKLTAAQVVQIREECERGRNQTAIAKQFNISESQVSHIKHRKQWAHI